MVDVCNNSGEPVNASMEADFRQRRATVSFKAQNQPSRYFVAITSNDSILEERVYSSYPPVTSPSEKASSAGVSGVRMVKSPEKALVDHNAELELEIRAGLEDRLQIEINGTTLSARPFCL